MIPSNAGFIDKNITYPIANLFVDHLHNIGLTPNMVTTITLLLRGISLYYLWNKKFNILVILLYILSWITDALDGSIARKFNMKTKYGGLYDLFVDWITFFSCMIIIYKHYYENNKTIFAYYLLFFAISNLIMSLKLICSKEKQNMKFWEKIIYKMYSLNCKYTTIYKLFDPGFCYLVWISFLAYTLFKYN